VGRGGKKKGRMSWGEVEKGRKGRLFCNLSREIGNNRNTILFFKIEKGRRGKRKLDKNLSVVRYIKKEKARECSRRKKKYQPG